MSSTAQFVRRRSLLLTALLLLAIFLPARLLARDWRVTDFHTTIGIDHEGSAVISERITLAFTGEYHGIHRFIPIEYPGPRGTNYTLFLKVRRVTDAAGHSLKYESSTSNGHRHDPHHPD